MPILSSSERKSSFCNKKADSFESAVIWCLRRESNPYTHCCIQDFKSCASTYSATKASIVPSYYPWMWGQKAKKSSSPRGLERSSGRRDSDSRPRPWQGRALPTELLPHVFKNFWECKDRWRFDSYKHFFIKFFLHFVICSLPHTHSHLKLPQ